MGSSDEPTSPSKKLSINLYLFPFTLGFFFFSSVCTTEEAVSEETAGEAEAEETAEAEEAEETEEVEEAEEDEE